MKSFIAKPSDIDRKWFVIDAEGKTLGKLAVEAASILRGKKKPTYTPHIDTGDYVVVINAETGYPGGLKETTLGEMRAKKPEEIIYHAVKGMMPKGKLGRQMFKKLKVYAGPEHPHTAQKPEVWNF